jgi:prevent-host-death family protein
VPKTVTIHDAHTNLSRLVDEVESGEEIVVARAGKPVARLMPMIAPRRVLDAQALDEAAPG